MILSEEKEKFSSHILVKSSLITLYLALTFPIPLIKNNDFRVFSTLLVFLGLILISSITNDYVITDKTSISFNTSFISNVLGKKSWKIYWNDIQQIKSFDTNQGSKVHYFVSSKGDKFLIPQRIDNLQNFLLLIADRTKLNIPKVNYISPLWTYKLLTSLSIIMIFTEIVAFKS